MKGLPILASRLKWLSLAKMSSSRPETGNATKPEHPFAGRDALILYKRLSTFSYREYSFAASEDGGIGRLIGIPDNRALLLGTIST
jgi:hypothetical protein